VAHLTLFTAQLVRLSASNSRRRATLSQRLRLQGEWESFLDLYGAGAVAPDSPNAELMIAASLHRWRQVASVLQRLLNEQQAAADEENADLTAFRVISDHAASSADAMAAPASKPAVGANNLRRSAPDDTGAFDGAAPPSKRLCSPADAARASEARGGGASTSAPAGAAAAARRLRAAPRTPSASLRGALDAQAQAAPPQSLATPQRSRQLQSYDGSAPGAGGAPASVAKRFDGASLTWLISQLMHTTEPGAPSQHMGQPCVSMRDRILLLLRPMMNFQEKVVYFQEEQDRMLDYHLSDLGDDESMHIEARAPRPASLHALQSEHIIERPTVLRATLQGCRRTAAL
jgi:hypothetical protein